MRMTQAEASRRYWERHRETILARARQRWRENDGAAKQREYRRANRKRLLARQHELAHSAVPVPSSTGRPLSERVTFQCVGYDDHGVIRHAKRCVRAVRLTAGEIEQQQRDYAAK